MPQALAPMAPALDADELAWLATLEDVESRLVFTEPGAAGTSYRVEQGPFPPGRLQQLPATDWTLLVHDVDKHLPDFRVALRALAFLPDWRIDDLMISFAATGGSVGPHRDNYDVFLCQAAGIREWRLAPAAAAVPASAPAALALLEPFEDRAARVARPGDVLYIPPGVPHWGVAAEPCLTWSLGMRAPALGELRAAAGLAPRTSDRDRLYTDPDLSAAEAEPGRIGAAVLARLRRQLCAEELPAQTLAIAMGTVVTTPKPSVTPDRPPPGECRALLRRFAETGSLRLHGMARLAWYADDDGGIVFANGRHRAVDCASVGLLKRLCEARMLGAAEAAVTPGLGALLCWLCAAGAFDDEPSERN